MKKKILCKLSMKMNTLWNLSMCPLDLQLIKVNTLIDEVGKDADNAVQLKTILEQPLFINDGIQLPGELISRIFKIEELEKKWEHKLIYGR